VAYRDLERWDVGEFRERLGDEANQLVRETDESEYVFGRLLVVQLLEEMTLE
jgi:hypothetical protein